MAVLSAPSVARILPPGLALLSLYSNRRCPTPFSTPTCAWHTRCPLPGFRIHAMTDLLLHSKEATMRTGHSILAGVITLATLSLATPAAAQQAQTREGFYAGVGLGWGSMGLSCDGCDGVDRTGSYTGY